MDSKTEFNETTVYGVCIMFGTLQC